MSDYEDGAFYWVVLYGRPEVAKCHASDDDGVSWEVTGAGLPYQTDDFDEIGPCIGKEPPKRRAPRKVKARPATSVELDNALRILLVR